MENNCNSFIYDYTECIETGKGRRFMKNGAGNNNRKGFTLAELLIVVAIIAVLVAVSIPVFNGQLEKSRRAADMADARNIAAVMAAGANDGTITFAKEYVPGSSTQRTVVCAVVNRNGISYSASGTVSFNGNNYDSGDSDYTRVKEYMNSCGITDIKVHSKIKENDGWLFYAVILYSDGTIRFASGNASDDSAAYTKKSGIEIPTTYWYSNGSSNIEKAMGRS